MMIQSEDGTGGILIPDGVLDDDAIERLKVAWMELHRGRVSKIDQEILPEVPPRIHRGMAEGIQWPRL